MSFSTKVRAELAELNLLRHPFYQSWNEGTLDMSTLRDYAKQYYYHVKAFPRYVSAAHSMGQEFEDRTLLMENLMDEEGKGHSENHPELWARFSDGLGVPRKELESAEPREAVKKVVATFLSNAYSSYEEGVASLFAYEHQVPEVADTKIHGLKENYNIDDERTLSFFDVHREADVFHTEALEKLLDKMPVESQEKALKAAKKSAQVLWDFLSSMQQVEEKNFDA